MHYFLVGCAFFAFHLLFAYLIDHLAVGVSFAIASAVSLVLVVSYARLFVGPRLALLHLGVPQLVFLVLFSWTFFWKGYTGLAITAGAIGTLFVVMQLTGRLDWNEVLGPRGRARTPGAPAAAAAAAAPDRE
jgi:inner membrane protein involved in colicin E2 resistance